MTELEVYEKFKFYFSPHDEDVYCWSGYGKNSVLIKMNDEQEFIFSYKKKGYLSFVNVNC